MTPGKVGAKEFEEALLAGSKRASGLTMSRYGVQVSMFDGKWTPVPSLPDFEGVLFGGRQFIIEAKVCSGPSFEVRKATIKPRQVSHMMERSAYGAQCFVIIHFCERQLVTRYDPGMTVAIPVHSGIPVWKSFLSGETSSLSRDAARDMGRLVLWTVPKGSRKPLPDLERLLSPEPQQMSLIQ